MKLNTSAKKYDEFFLKKLEKNNYEKSHSKRFDMSLFKRRQHCERDRYQPERIAGKNRGKNKVIENLLMTEERVYLKKQEWPNRMIERFKNCNVTLIKQKTDLT